MKFGTFLYIKQPAEELKSQMEKYPIVSWDEVLDSNFNCVLNTDHTGMQFEGEIETIKRVDDRIFLKCKWLNALKPFFDDDGDICRDKMSWEHWHVRETSFSINDSPRKTPDGSKVIIQSWCGHEYFTTTTLAIVQEFNSLKND